MLQFIGMIGRCAGNPEQGVMNSTLRTTPTYQDAMPGNTLHASWPRIPVAHLSFETDFTFSTLHCLNA
jgi:hypothetical protein